MSTRQIAATVAVLSAGAACHAQPFTETFEGGVNTGGWTFGAPVEGIQTAGGISGAYLRGSMVFGQFRDSWEYAGGAKWYFLPTERMWLQAELMRVQNCPYGGTFTPYTPGLTGWVPMIQGMFSTIQSNVTSASGIDASRFISGRRPIWNR